MAFVYRRKDDGQDPPELRPANADNAQAIAASAHRLLDRAKRIPGTGEDGNIDARKLVEWVVRVRELSRECSRELIAESIVGQLLGRSPTGGDGIWPHEAVREFLEGYGSTELANGMCIGLYNSRGAFMHDGGGAQERTLAETHRGWSRQLASQNPFTARLLAEIARMYDGEGRSGTTRTPEFASASRTSRVEARLNKQPEAPREVRSMAKPRRNPPRSRSTHATRRYYRKLWIRRLAS